MDRVKRPFTVKNFLKDALGKIETTCEEYIFYSIEDLKTSIEKDPTLEYGENGIICYSRHPVTVRIILPELGGDEGGEFMEFDGFRDNVTLEDELHKQIIIHPRTAGNVEHKLMGNCSLEKFLTHSEFPKYPGYTFNNLIRQMMIEDGLTINPVLIYNHKTNELHLATHHYNEEFTINDEEKTSFRSP